MNWDYIAGFFDGEGCFTVVNRKNGGIKYQLALSQTEKYVLDEIQKYINVGKVYESCNKGNKNWKPYWKKAYTLRISKREDILFFLSNIEDKIIVKKEELYQKKKILLKLKNKRNQKIKDIRENLKICKKMREENKTWKEIGEVINKNSESARCFVKENKKKEIYQDIFGT
jgi:hypothetical protein